jgi:hypothetical protein
LPVITLQRALVALTCTSCVKRVRSSFQSALRATVRSEYPARQASITPRTTGSRSRPGTRSCAFTSNHATATAKPASGMKRKRSFNGVPRSTTRLLTTEKVARKKRMPNAAGWRFGSCHKAHSPGTASPSRPAHARGASQPTIGIIDG